MSDRTSIDLKNPFPSLDAIELATYEWQMWADGIGELGQRKLKAATVLISRIGGVGGTVALQLAAAGIGKLILAHAGEIKASDLNRQLLMSPRSNRSIQSGDRSSKTACAQPAIELGTPQREHKCRKCTNFDKRSRYRCRLCTIV